MKLSTALSRADDALAVLLYNFPGDFTGPERDLLSRARALIIGHTEHPDQSR
jgi:hypothetical protein